MLIMAVGLGHQRRTEDFAWLTFTQRDAEAATNTLYGMNIYEPDRLTRYAVPVSYFTHRWFNENQIIYETARVYNWRTATTSTLNLRYHDSTMQHQLPVLHIDGEPIKFEETLIFVGQNFGNFNHIGAAMLYHMPADWFIQLTDIAEDNSWAVMAATNGNYDIYRINIDGSHIQQLTDTPQHDEYLPTIAPNDEHIAYMAQSVVYIMASDGSAERMVTDMMRGFNVIGLHWSSDSQWLYVYMTSSRNSANRDRTRYALAYRVRPDGSGLTYVGSFVPHKTLPSPDKRYLLIRRFEETDTELYVLDTHTQEVAVIDAPPTVFSFPAWSPDSQWLVMQGMVDPHVYTPERNINLFMVRPDGSDFTMLTDYPTWEEQPAFLPLVFGRWVARGWAMGGGGLMLLGVLLGLVGHRRQANTSQ